MCSARSPTSRSGITNASSPSSSARRSPTTTQGHWRSLESDRSHEPVLAAEVVELLRPQAGGVFVDCTLGLGGHTAALLSAGASRVIGIDRDESAIAIARERLAVMASRVVLVHADYRRLG